MTHFGYLESGSMGIKFKDDPDNIKIIKVGRPCGNQISRASPPARHRRVACSTACSMGHWSICAQAGETYLVPPGHIPVMNEDAVMVEFTQDTTYTNAEVQAKMKD